MERLLLEKRAVAAHQPNFRIFCLPQALITGNSSQKGQYVLLSDVRGSALRT
jgi:hypothetical protein